MGNFLKFGLIGLGACLFLCALSVLIFAAVFDPNDYKDRISRAVFLKTGRTLSFDGDISLTFFPVPGVSLGGLSLGNADGFGSEPMLSVRSAHVTVRLLPLFAGKIRFRRLELDGPVLNLGRNVLGGTNWDDLVGRKPDAAGAGAEAGRSAFGLDVAGLAVTDGRLIWDDRETGVRGVLRGIEAATGRTGRDGLFPVKLSVDIDCGTPDVNGTLTLEGRASFDPANLRCRLAGMRASVKASGAFLPGGAVHGNLTLRSLTVDFNRAEARFAGLEGTAYGATLLADGAVRGEGHGLGMASADLTLRPTDLRKVFAGLGVPLPDTADPQALTEVGGTAKVEFKPGRLTVENGELSVDGCRVTGRGVVERGGAWPRFTVQLEAGEVDVDRYLPLGRAVGGASRAWTRGELPDGAVLPAEILRRLDFDLDVKAAGLSLGGARFTNVAASAVCRAGLLTVDPLSAEGYGGVVRVAGNVDVQQGEPVVRIRSTAAHLDVGGLARDVTGGAEYAGILDCAADLNGRGERAPELLGTLGGELSFKLSDGVFPGVDLVRMARTTHSAKGRDTVESTRTDATRFGSIAGTATVKDGIVSNKDLEVKAPGLRADGHGAFSLVTRKIDYMVKAKLVPTGEGQGGKSSGELFGIMVPIHVTGTIDEPHYWVSVQEYAKALGGAVIDTVGTVLGGVGSVVRGVGSAIGGGTTSEEPGRKKFLGIF
ncbi:AsmA family protein [Desulfovibrio sp. Huiquan2017]|uniref:AsmA family protein n=1 Tax=Desulfovibrio sp. Huiquan2017 TaxID=2816861 RepID=UPI001A90EA03|nr:AsmA family protein [Desulfovibrio sp. Huiquan2017]